MSVAHCQGNVREFHSVWRVVTLLMVNFGIKIVFELLCCTQNYWCWMEQKIVCNGNCSVVVALCSTAELVAAYRESCKQMGVKPLNKLVQQLEV